MEHTSTHFVLGLHRAVVLNKPLREQQVVERYSASRNVIRLDVHACGLKQKLGKGPICTSTRSVRLISTTTKPPIAVPAARWSNSAIATECQARPFSIA